MGGRETCSLRDLPQEFHDFIYFCYRINWLLWTSGPHNGLIMSHLGELAIGILGYDTPSHTKTSELRWSWVDRRSVV